MATFDAETYGKKLLSEPGSVVDAFRAWQSSDRPQSFDEFGAWVRAVTGLDLFDLLGDDEMSALVELIGTDRDAAIALIEGSQTGP